MTDQPTAPGSCERDLMSETSAVRALVKKWRDHAELAEYEYGYALEACADELESALRDSAALTPSAYDRACEVCHGQVSECSTPSYHKRTAVRPSLGLWPDRWPSGGEATLTPQPETREQETRELAEIAVLLVGLGINSGGLVRDGVRELGRQFQMLQSGILDRDARLANAHRKELEAASSTLTPTQVHLTKSQAIGGGAQPEAEDDSQRSWRCGCYENQGGYHLCYPHLSAAEAPLLPSLSQERTTEEDTRQSPSVPRGTTGSPRTPQPKGSER